MNDIFISYNKSDHEFAQDLTLSLQEKGMSCADRDQTIYGRKGWPGEIGTAISNCHCHVLIWTKQASISHIIEFEWHIATLLERKLLVIAADATPFRFPTFDFVTIETESPEATVMQIRKELKGHHPTLTEERLESITRKFRRFNETKPAQVTRKMRIIYFGKKNSP